ncbi:MAG: hypothetical protein EOP53_02710 [Sphingobacteriales bacterium]|nr:MAG: hypothetical protein EOP53_02710 [Sphingobacteriales bacterium]
MKILKSIGILFFFLFCFYAEPAAAQCPMCKANVESTMKGPGRKTGLGLNDGIVVLLSMPYIAFAVVGLLWYKNSKKNKNSIVRP